MARQRRALRLEDWPDRDRQDWEHACRPPDFLDAGGHAAGWTEATRKQVVKGYGKWLGFLAIADSFDPSAAPADRVTPARLKLFVRWMEREGLASTTIASRVTDLREAIRVMAPQGG